MPKITLNTWGCGWIKSFDGKRHRSASGPGGVGLGNKPPYYPKNLPDSIGSTDVIWMLSMIYAQREKKDTTTDKLEFCSHFSTEPKLHYWALFRPPQFQLSILKHLSFPFHRENIFRESGCSWWI